MSFRAMDHSVTVVAYEKGGKKYGMTCAWAMMVDYDKLLLLLGAQSSTAKNIKKNDFNAVLNTPLISAGASFFNELN